MAAGLFSGIEEEKGMMIEEPAPKERAPVEEESKEEPVATETPEESEPQKEEVEVVKTVSQLKTEKRRQRKKKEDEPVEARKTQPEDLFTFDEG